MMPDRRSADELTIEELEQILIVKRREARAERMRRMRDIGRLPTDAPLPHEDLSAISPAAAPSTAALEPPLQRQVTYGVEPLGRWKRRRSKARRAESPQRGGDRTRLGRLRDRLLLILEVGALLGLVVVLISSVLNLRFLNEEYAQASQPPMAPTVEPTPLAGGILPGGHAPPEEPGSVPSHLRSLVEGQAPPVVEIPTPGPQAPTHIVIPAINVDALVVEGDTPEQLKLGVGHHLGSADPGERGNMILSAHDDIYGEIFRHLPDLELGDEITIYAGEQPYRYVVTAKQIVEPTAVEVLAATTKPVVTLISCYPYMVDSHRIVVVGELQ
jgi:sortase A